MKKCLDLIKKNEICYGLMRKASGNLLEAIKATLNMLGIQSEKIKELTFEFLKRIFNPFKLRLSKRGFLIKR